MDRRSFFKGMFGAAALATLPKPVFDKVIEEPVIIPNRLNETDEVGQIEQGCPFDEPLPEYKGYGLVIYKGNQLVATSYDFNLEAHRNYIYVSSLDDLYSRWLYSPAGFRINSNKISWHSDPEEILRNNQLLDCIITTPDIKITGQVELINVYKDIECSFLVVGAMIIE